MRVNRTALAIAAVAVLLVTAAIAARTRGVAKATVPSPDLRSVAVVRAHWTPDPPSESLWLGQVGERARRLETLGEDQEWCSEIVWAGDSSAVAFVITGVRALVVEAGSNGRRTWVQLVAEDDYPSSREARTVRFSPDGRSLEFRDCARGGGDCRDRRLRIPAWRIGRPADPYVSVDGSLTNP